MNRNARSNYGCFVVPLAYWIFCIMICLLIWQGINWWVAVLVGILLFPQPIAYYIYGNGIKRTHEWADSGEMTTPYEE